MLILIAGVFQRYLALMFVRRLPLCMSNESSSCPDLWDEVKF
jgi:hypothetical protein